MPDELIEEIRELGAAYGFETQPFCRLLIRQGIASFRKTGAFLFPMSRAEEETLQAFRRRVEVERMRAEKGEEPLPPPKRRIRKKPSPDQSATDPGPPPKADMKGLNREIMQTLEASSDDPLRDDGCEGFAVAKETLEQTVVIVEEEKSTSSGVDILDDIGMAESQPVKEGGLNEDDITALLAGI